MQKSHEVITRTSNEIQQRRLERRIGVGEGRREERSLFWGFRFIVLAVRAQTRDSYEKAENLDQRGRDAGGGDQ